MYSFSIIRIRKFVICLQLLPLLCIGQNNRIFTHNNIGWYNHFVTVKISGKISIHAEYQWRRNRMIYTWQQSLLRVGMNYQVRPNVLLRAGYAFLETFPYGEIPINSYGKTFTEHRFFQMIQLNNKEGWVDLTHRFMLEQRFVGRYSSPSLNQEDSRDFLNRIRYLVRVKFPIGIKESPEKKLFAVLYDEIFIGFGKKVNANVFDQNRLGLLLGYRFSPNISIETGCMQQMVQLGRQINGKNIFQDNRGIIVNCLYQIGPYFTEKKN
jgi:hypothetical protein